ncbi:MAG: regulatory protein RecX [Candidatus Omnitrophota bacterium]
MSGGEGVAQDVEKARKAAFRLLRFRPRSTWELTTRLRKTFTEETCHIVLQELLEKRLLDDEAFSRFWIENRVQFKPVSKALLAQELRAKGVNPSVIQEALGSTPQSDRAMAERLLASRHKRIGPKDPKRYERLYRFLRSRGFTHELVSELLEKDAPETHDR